MAMTNDDLSRPIKIHVCKDRTLSYRAKGEPVFNGRALPVFSVDTKEEAEQLFLLTGRLQYTEHPQMPGKLWRKVTLPGALDFKPYLDLSDLDTVTDHLRDRYNLIKTHEKAETGV